MSRSSRTKKKPVTDNPDFDDLKKSIAACQAEGITFEEIARFLTDPGPPRGVPVVGDRLSAARRQAWDPRALDDPWDSDDGDPFGPAHET